MHPHAAMNMPRDGRPMVSFVSKLLPQFQHTLLEPERSYTGSKGVISPLSWRTEPGHCDIPDKFVQVSLLGLNHLRAEREVFIHHNIQLRQRDLFGKRHIPLNTGAKRRNRRFLDARSWRCGREQFLPKGHAAFSSLSTRLASSVPLRPMCSLLRFPRFCGPNRVSPTPSPCPLFPPASRPPAGCVSRRLRSQARGARIRRAAAGTR